jgi:hypothetical protein
MRFRSLILRLALSVAASGLILFVLARLVGGAGGPDAHPRLLEVLRHAAPHLIALYALCAVGQGLVRAWRYRVLLAAGGAADALPGFGHLYLVTQARNMLVDLLPARLGEFGYVAMLNRGYHIGAGNCFASMGISFLFDLIALLLILGTMLLNALLRAAGHGSVTGLFCLLAVVSALGFLFVFRGLRLIARLAHQVLPAGRSRAMDALTRFLTRLADAVDAVRRARVLGRVLTLSLLVRGIKYTGLICAFRAVAGPGFPALATLPVGALLSALIGAEAAASLPVPAFMSFGTYEAGGMLILTLFGATAAASRLVMLGVHIWTQVVDYTLGGAALCGFTFLVRGGTGHDKEQRGP